MAKNRPDETVTSWNTKRTVKVTSSPAGRLKAECSAGDWTGTDAGGNDVRQNARDHLRWNHQ